tara:strand:+ start:5339 stop:5779 length:441 start_codon:yes stop_codon:yes gene_type:complete
VKEERMTVIKAKLLSENATLPTRGSKYAAGLDLYSAEARVIYPGTRYMVSTDVSLSIPNNMYLRIAPRSGLAFEYGIDVMAGVVDCDYTGTIKVILMNHGDHPFPVHIGDRVAQGILEHISLCEVLEVKNIPKTARGSDGLGSTGR